MDDVRERARRRTARLDADVDSLRPLMPGQSVWMGLVTGVRRGAASKPGHLLRSPYGTLSKLLKTAPRLRPRTGGTPIGPTMTRTLAYLDPGSGGVIIQMIVGGVAALGVMIKIF